MTQNRLELACVLVHVAGVICSGLLTALPWWDASQNSNCGADVHHRFFVFTQLCFEILMGLLVHQKQLG